MRGVVVRRWALGGDAAATQRAEQLLDAYALRPAARLRQLLGLPPSPDLPAAAGDAATAPASSSAAVAGPSQQQQPLSAQTTKLLVHAEIVKVRKAPFPFPFLSFPTTS